MVEKKQAVNEFKEAEKKETSSKITKPKNPWIVSTAILVIVAVILSFFALKGGITGNVINEKDAADKLINYLNTRAGGGVGFISVEDLGSLYKVMVSYKGDQIPVFITKDGEYFVQGAIPLAIEAVEQVEQQPQQPSQPIDVSLDDDAVKGNENAPVTIVEFSDYQCPFCGRYFKQTLPQIIEEYVDTGKVKLVFRDFPLSFHQDAQKAAEAAECAGEQGKYWEMHDKLFENQDALSIENLKQYAKDLKLNSKKFNNCLDSGEMAEEVKKDMADGQDYGVSGTPAFFINGKKLEGAQPFSAFKEIINAELNK